MTKRENTRESGAALISVLCLIFTAGMLTAASLALAKLGSFSVASHVKMQRSMLVSEGVANRVQWLIAADRALYTTIEKLGDTLYDEYDYDRYLADGTPHVIDYYGEEVQFTITDTIGGVDLADGAYTSALRSLGQNRGDDADWSDFITALRSQIADYVDSNSDQNGDDGMEEAEYEAQNMRPLPRNAAMQFREELMYLPAFRDLFTTDRNGRLSAVRLIPPENTVSLSGTPSLMTATDDMLKSYCNLEDGEVTEVRDALNAWFKERTPLSDSLNEELLAKLDALARFESGAYTVTVEVPPAQKRPVKRLTFSFSAFPISGPEEEKVRYLEWMFH